MKEQLACKECGAELTNLRTAWKEATGYVSPHGADSMIGRRNTGRFICPDCALKIRHGLPIGQQVLA